MIGRKTAGAFFFCTVIGSVIGSLVGWSMDPLQANQPAVTTAKYTSAEFAQSTNTTGKGDRLAVYRQYDTQSFNSQPFGTQLASLAPVALAPTDLFPGPTFAPALQPPEALFAPRQAVPAPKPEKPRIGTPASSAILDDAQIASIKRRLRLTPDQVGYWPAVESALRDVARHQAAEARKRRPHATPAPLDVNSAEVQRLISAATPLLQRMREDQKREVRMLVRMLGLSTVASYI